MKTIVLHTPRTMQRFTSTTIRGAVTVAEEAFRDLHEAGTEVQVALAGFDQDEIIRTNAYFMGIVVEIDSVKVMAHERGTQ